jgi:hypothetical protein
MKNICDTCDKTGKCFFEINSLVCKKLLEKNKGEKSWEDQ